MGMAQRLSPFVRGFLFAPKDHQHAAFRIELDHHVRALIGRPNVVILVDFHRVRERPGVEIVADLANEFAVGIELQELSGACTIGGADGVTARKHEHVSVGVYGHTRDLPEVDVGR